MNLETYLKTLREIKDISSATVNNYGNPKVRIIDL